MCLVALEGCVEKRNSEKYGIIPFLLFVFCFLLRVQISINFLFLKALCYTFYCSFAKAVLLNFLLDSKYNNEFLEWKLCVYLVFFQGVYLVFPRAYILKLFSFIKIFETFMTTADICYTLVVST